MPKPDPIAVNQIHNLRSLARHYRLQGAEQLDKYTDEQLAEWYNGAGPESWDPIFRSAMNIALGLYAPAVLLHDVAFQFSDGSEEGFAAAAAAWKNNTRAIFSAEYPWLTKKMLESSYRRERLYWGAIMHVSNIAVSTEKAYDAWLAAHQSYKEAV